jgi:hypothetical protein
VARRLLSPRARTKFLWGCRSGCHSWRPERPFPTESRLVGRRALARPGPIQRPASSVVIRSHLLVASTIRGRRNAYGAICTSVSGVQSGLVADRSMPHNEKTGAEAPVCLSCEPFAICAARPSWAAGICS